MKLSIAITGSIIALLLVLPRGASASCPYVPPTASNTERLLQQQCLREEKKERLEAGQKALEREEEEEANQKTSEHTGSKPESTVVPLTLATAPEFSREAIEGHFKYSPSQFQATRCRKNALRRLDCHVSWFRSPNAYAGTAELGNIHNEEFTYGLRIVRTNVHTHKHHTIVVPY